jgi:hypothetical protein
LGLSDSSYFFFLVCVLVFIVFSFVPFQFLDRICSVILLGDFRDIADSGALCVSLSLHLEMLRGFPIP